MWERFSVYSWLHAWVQLADGLASVLTLGLWWPNWSFEYTCWNAIRKINASQKLIKESQKVTNEPK